MSFRALRVSQIYRVINRNNLIKTKQKLNMFCSKNGENNKLIVPPQQSQLVANNDLENPWKPTNGPQGGIYYWNTLTNETTPVGAPKPDHWVEVKDPNGSALTYWWNPEKNLTTPLGTGKPQSITTYNPSYNQPPQSFGGNMLQMMTLGFGMSIAFGVVGALFR